jgi:hypothetical protein
MGPNIPDWDTWRTIMIAERLTHLKQDYASTARTAIVDSSIITNPPSLEVEKQ